MTSVTPTRRERLRAATVEEIHATARRLLVSEGQAGVTLRAISREMGMTAPALYRYYDSLESLLEGLCATLYHECSAYIEESAADAAQDDPAHGLATASRAFRRWSIAHPAEFTMMFASPVGGGKGDVHNEVVHAAGMRFAAVFLQRFVRVWREQPFPVLAAEAMAPQLRSQFEDFLTHTGVDIPLGAAQVFTSCWIRLYGMVALEVFGHLHFTLPDCEPMFEAELEMIARQLGLELPPP